MRFIPLGKGGTPLLSYKDHPEIITEDTEWFDEAVDQGYGIGVYLDNSGLVVIDTDSSLSSGPVLREEFGWKSFLDMCTETLGLPGIPPTFTVETKTKGHYHLYYKQNEKYPLTRTSIHTQIPNVDVKVTGYVKHWKCEGYRVARNVAVITLPTLIAAYLYRAPYRKAESGEAYGDGRVLTSDFADYMLEKLGSTVNGSRNMQLFKAAKTFREAGLTDRETQSRLSHAAVRAGLTLHEATRTIESAWEIR